MCYAIFSTYGVTIQVPADYPTIQEAINNANNGDIILVAPGTYSGDGNYNINFYGKLIEVKSESGPGNTVIDCQQLGSGFILTSGETNSSIIDGFKIINGNNIDIAGGIHCNWSGPTIQNCIIENCISENEYGGILVHNSTSVSNSIIQNCTIQDCTGGISIRESEVLLENCFVQNNTGNNQIKVTHYSTAYMNNCIINANYASVNGVRIYFNANLFIKNSLIEKSNYWGIDVSNYSDVDIINSIVKDHTEFGVFNHVISYGSTDIINSNIINNGNGIYCQNTPCNIINSIVANNDDLQIEVWSNPMPYAEYSNIQDRFSGGISGLVNWGEGNIDENPLFLNPNGEEIIDYNLQQGSACINSGNPTGDYEELDILGNLRVVDNVIDMGAIENQGALNIIVSATPQIVCQNQNSQLSANATGGSGSYTYSWTSNPPGFTSNIANPIVSPTETTEYTVEVSDGTTTNDESVIVTVNYLPGSAEIINGPSDVCRGDQNIIYSVPEIEFADSYNWSLPSGFTIISGENTNSIEVAIESTAESGQVSVEGLNNCGTGNSSTLNINTNYVTASAGPDQSIYYGTTTSLTGSASDGSNNYNWNWEPESSLLDSDVQNPTTINLIDNTEFTLTVSDVQTGCTDSDNVLIEVGEQMLLTISANPSEVCSGINSQLSAIASGGDEIYTYSWTSNPSGFTSDIANPIVTPTETTVYTVEVSDGTTTLVESVTVTVNDLPDEAGSINGDSEVCRGEQNIIYSVPEIEYADSYNWILPTGIVITSGENTNSIEVIIGSSAVSGQISVEGVNDCGTGVSSSFDVSVHYVTADAGIDQTIVYGTSTTLSGNAENGSGDYSWNWEPVSMLLDANIQNPETVALETNTEFTLTVTDNSYGCSDDDQINVFIETEELTVVATVDPEEIQWNETAQLDAIVAGGLMDYIFSWTSYPEGFTSDIQNPEVSPGYTTVYHIEVNDGESTVSDSIILIVYAAPAIPNQPIGPDSVELANNETSQYFTPYIPGALTYNWNLSPENAGILETNANSVLINWNPEFTGWCYLSVNAINEYGESEYSEVLEIYIDYLINTNSIQANNISLFPNPTKDILFINGIKPFTEYHIINSLGKTIQSGQIKKETMLNVETNSFEPGIYFIQFINGNELTAKKFIKN